MAIPIDVLSQVIGPLLQGADACRFGITCKELYATYLERVPPIQRAFHILAVLERTETTDEVEHITKFLLGNRMLERGGLLPDKYDLYDHIPSSLVNGGQRFAIWANWGKKNAFLEMHGFSQMDYFGTWGTRSLYRSEMHRYGYLITQSPHEYQTRGKFWMFLKDGKDGETTNIEFTRVCVLPGFERPGDGGDMEWWLEFRITSKNMPNMRARAAAFKQAMFVLDLFRKYNPEFANVHVGSMCMTFMYENMYEDPSRMNTHELYNALRAHGFETPTDAEIQAKFGPWPV